MKDPVLSPEVYEMVLNHLLLNDNTVSYSLCGRKANARNF